MASCVSAGQRADAQDRTGNLPITRRIVSVDSGSLQASGVRSTAPSELSSTTSHRHFVSRPVSRRPVRQPGALRLPRLNVLPIADCVVHHRCARYPGLPNLALLIKGAPCGRAERAACSLRAVPSAAVLIRAAPPNVEGRPPMMPARCSQASARTKAPLARSTSLRPPSASDHDRQLRRAWTGVMRRVKNGPSSGGRTPQRTRELGGGSG
jgi:hypothetical protein